MKGLDESQVITMKKVITISREFGSGGRTIGKEVAKKLGYEYYDKEIIEKIASESGLSKSFIEENAEHAPGTNIFSYAFVGRNENGESISDYLWKAQCKVINDIAEKGNCVIVGRCADYILLDRIDCLHVFVHADMEKRIDRIINLYGETNEKPEKRIIKKDKKRKANYKYYTDRTWGMSQNYHITLDSGVIGIDKCVDVICDLAKDLK